jgi:hypothetical protein
VIKSVFGGSRSGMPDAKASLAAEMPQVWTGLAKQAPICDPLPLVHPSVPYTMAFYHVHAVMGRALAGQDPSPLLAAFTCRGANGSAPSISWEITPKIVGTNFLIQHAYTFTIPLKYPFERPPSGVLYKKNWFVNSGFRNFGGCPHSTRIFRSIREESKNAMYYVGVEHCSKNVLGQTFQYEWRSELGQQPQNMACGMCYTDYAMNFQIQGAAVIVRVWTHKDLGNCMDPFDPTWIAALRGTAIQRPKTDFGRIRNAFWQPSSQQASSAPGP